MYFHYYLHIPRARNEMNLNYLRLILAAAILPWKVFIFNGKKFKAKKEFFNLWPVIICTGQLYVFIVWREKIISQMICIKFTGYKFYVCLTSCFLKKGTKVSKVFDFSNLKFQVLKGCLLKPSQFFQLNLG